VPVARLDESPRATGTSPGSQSNNSSRNDFFLRCE
jgi:hypothetical protein